MNQASFNPNEITVPNGCFFGFPYSVEEATIVFLPVPWDVTTSYREGSANGPQAILDASVQLDWYDFDLPQAWQTRCGTIPINSDIQDKNRTMRAIAKEIIEYLETGGNVDDIAVSASIFTDLGNQEPPKKPMSAAFLLPVPCPLFPIP